MNATCTIINRIILILGTLSMLFPFFLDIQRNEFPNNLSTSKINYIMPKLLESYDI